MVKNGGSSRAVWALMFVGEHWSLDEDALTIATQGPCQSKTDGTRTTSWQVMSPGVHIDRVFWFQTQPTVSQRHRPGSNPSSHQERPWT